MHIAKVYFTVKPCLEFQHSQIFEKRHREAEHCSIKAFSTQWRNGDVNDIKFIIHSSYQHTNFLYLQANGSLALFYRRAD